MTRALVIGASGVAGAALGTELDAAGYELQGLARGARPAGWPGEWHRADVLDHSAIAGSIAVAAPDVVFHLVSVRDGSLAELMAVNVLGLEGVLDAVAATCAAAAVVVVGSSAEYGVPPGAGARITEDAPLRPVTDYGVSKAAQGLLALQRVATGLRIVHARTFNLVGPGLPDTLAPGAFARQLAEIEAGRRESVVRTGALGATRDFVDVRDAVRAWRLLAEQADPGVYNVCSGRPTLVRDVLSILVAHASVPVSVEERAPSDGRGDVPAQVGDPSLLIAATGWGAATSLESSLADLLGSWRVRVAQTT